MTLESNLEEAALRFQCERLERELIEARRTNDLLCVQVAKHQGLEEEWRTEAADLRKNWHHSQAKLTLIPLWLRRAFRAL